MANTTNTPKHTDPATKRDEKKNETEVKDKVSGKTKTTQKNMVTHDPKEPGASDVPGFFASNCVRKSTAPSTKRFSA